MPTFFHSPWQRQKSWRERTEKWEKKFFSEMAASGGTFVPPDAAISHSFKVPALEGGDLGVGDDRN